MYNRITLAEDLGGGKKPIPQSQLQRFGNWTGQSDTKFMAADLMKRGLVGADKLLLDNPNPNDRNSIINSQSDWKPNAIMEILSNARKLNLRTPEEINANRNVLMTTPKYRDAINNPSFTQIHKNFWDIITHSILPEQYAKEEAQKVVAKK